MAWRDAALATQALPAATLAIGCKLDHLGALVRVAVPTRTLGSTSNYDAKPLPWYNRFALKLPAVQERIMAAWRVTPPLPDLDAESLVGLFSKYCRLLLAEHCPPSRKAPRADWVQPATWRAMTHHAQLRR